MIDFDRVAAPDAAEFQFSVSSFFPEIRHSQQALVFSNSAGVAEAVNFRKADLRRYVTAQHHCSLNYKACFI